MKPGKIYLISLMCNFLNLWVCYMYMFYNNVCISLQAYKHRVHDDRCVTVSHGPQYVGQQFELQSFSAHKFYIRWRQTSIVLDLVALRPVFQATDVVIFTWYIIHINCFLWQELWDDNSFMWQKIRMAVDCDKNTDDVFLWQKMWQLHLTYRENAEGIDWCTRVPFL